MAIRYICAATIWLFCSITDIQSADRSADQMRSYAQRRIADAEEEQLTEFVTALDSDDDGTITDAEFAKRIEVFQQIFVTVMPVAKSVGHELPEQWLTEFDKAREQSTKSGKPLLVMFSASWCGPCKSMIANVYPTDEAKQALEDFVPVYIDSELHVDLASKHEIRAYPTYVCLDTDGERIAQHVGGGSVEDFLAMLTSFQESDQPQSDSGE